LGSEDFVNAYFKDANDKDYDCYLFIIGFKGFANILYQMGVNISSQVPEDPVLDILDSHITNFK